MVYRYYLDLRFVPPGVPPQSHAYTILHRLNAHETLKIWSPEEPTLLVAQLQHQMRHTLLTSVTRDGDGWAITIRVRGDREPLPLVDTLRRDHDHMDRQFVHAMQLLAGDRPAEGVAAVTQLQSHLRAHIAIENELLAPLGQKGAPEATGLMLREHNDLLDQLALIGELCDTAAEPRDLDTWLGLLAASLNKHESREESLLFPEWARVLARKPDQENLLAEVRSRLGTLSAPESGAA
ncbi:MAG: hemerythrin domain-containing protein [Gammaproteobacteria bacterium]|nr:hemerythrin domain-containing protein [Gammaproteobacteria bacterium]